MINTKTAKTMLANIKYSMGRNKVSNRPVKEVSITETDIIDLYHKQNGKCYWTGLLLDGHFNTVKHHPFAISADRLDNSKGYTKDNVVLVRRMFNLGRMSFPEKDFADAMRILKEEFNAN